MSRGRKFSEGLDFYPLDVDIMHNDKIKILRSTHGRDAVLFLILLWSNIYKKNYYREWTERPKKVFCNDNGFTVEEADAYLNTCIEEDIFDRQMYDNYQILTSDRMQDIFLDVTVRRQRVVFIKEYLLVDIKSAANIKRIVLLDRSGREYDVAKGVKPSKKGAQPELGFDQIHDNPGQINGDQLKKYVETPYAERGDDFKKIYSEKWYLSYVKFSTEIINKYKNLLICNNQITIHQWMQLSTAMVPAPNQKEINWCLPKLSGAGVKDTGSLYHRLIDFIGYNRDDIAKANAKRPAAAAPAPSKSKVLFDQKSGIDRTVRKG